jgi:citrate synthase
MTTETSETTSTAKQNRGGLEGIVAAMTSLSKVEGTAGRLIYRGYNIHDLAGKASFEEIAYLLWYGKLPTKMELVDLKVQMLEERTLPTAVLQVLNYLPPTAAPMDALRTAVSAFGAAMIQ